MSCAGDLKGRIAWLESELPPESVRFRLHADLPFAILVYDPREEWDLRREVRLLATRLRNRGMTVGIISLAELLWEAIARTEGIEAVAELERMVGFEAAQEQVYTYLSEPDLAPLPRMLAQRLDALAPEPAIGLVVHAAALAPDIYPISQLVVRMQGLTRTSAVLFYPGTREGTNGLRFMSLPNRDLQGSYRVKVYA